jgi:hypothetical protein
VRAAVLSEYFLPTLSNSRLRYLTSSVPACPRSERTVERRCSKAWSLWVGRARKTSWLPSLVAGLDPGLTPGPVFPIAYWLLLT